MEYFYRTMRKKYNILMDADGSPTGGFWNYDKENRKPPSSSIVPIKRITHKKSYILKNVLELVRNHFDHHFGDLDPFYYAITRDQALIELDHFIDKILPHFGDYQDAMLKDDAYLYHSLLSSYINMGLLLPLEICQKAEEAYKNGKVALNSAEGFIRQILGWREFIRGIYWLKMPDYGELNTLDAKTPVFLLCMLHGIGLKRSKKMPSHPRHLIRYVLSKAKKLGARYCFLESSDSGFDVYQKIGFKTLFKNNIYSRKA